MAIVYVILFSCGLLRAVFLGCPDEPGRGTIEMHRAGTDRIQVEADATARYERAVLMATAQAQGVQARATAQAQGAALHATAVAHQAAVQATAQAHSERETTYRTEVLNAGITERLYAQENEVTRRWEMGIWAALWAVIIGAACWIIHSLHGPPVRYRPIIGGTRDSLTVDTDTLPAINLDTLRRRAQTQGWHIDIDFYDPETGQRMAVCLLPDGGERYYLLEDKNVS